MNNDIDSANRIVAFDDHKIRRVLHNNEWWYVIVDVVAALTDSSRPAGYLTDMRRRDSELNKGWWQIASTLPVETIKGKQKLNCSNTKGIFTQMNGNNVMWVNNQNMQS